MEFSPISLILQCIFLWICSSCAQTRPHVIFIVADDLGWNDVSWHNPGMVMPNLDKMARSGVILNSSYVQPMCSPSRNSFMSGYYPYHTGLQHFVILAAQATGLPLNLTLLPERMKGLGYATHIIGKWHLGFCNWNYTPTYRGFDSFLGYYTSMEKYYTHVRDYRGYVGLDFHLDKEPNFSENGTYSPYVFVNRAIEIIEGHNISQPLFLYLPFQNVHAPLQVPRKYEDIYSHIKNITRRKYCGMVTALDEAIGNITQVLDQEGYLDNALIIFTTDNGGPVWAGSNNLPLRGAKTTLWEGGTKGSAFVYSRTLLQKTGYVNTGLIHAVDWFPTILDAVGGEPEPGIDGISVWDMISQGASPPRSEFIYNIDDIKNNSAIRMGDYKLIEGHPGGYNDWYPLPGDSTAGILQRNEIGQEKRNGTRHRLFNIKNDPSERMDLSANETEIITKMIARLEEYKKSLVKARFPKDDPNSDPKNFGGVWSPGWC